MNDRRMPKNHRNHNLDADIDSVHDETRLKITLIDVFQYSTRIISANSLNILTYYTAVIFMFQTSKVNKRIELSTIS